MESVQPALDTAKCLGAPVCKYLQYHRKLNDYIKNFKNIKDELNSKMKDIEQGLEIELRQVGKKPREEVQNWLKKVKEMINEAQRVESKVDKGKYLLRAWLGKLVDEKTQEMQKILDKAASVSDSLVIDDPFSGLPLPTSELIGDEGVRGEIWSYLMQEDVTNIGVWGMGGVGKTAIMKRIHNDLLEGKRFDEVIWVTISKEFNIMKLQEAIARALNGDLSEEGDKERRAALLLDMLKRAKKHVLILDDVWDEISLEEVGIPEPTSSNGCKLVLTTRIEQVCKSIGCKVIKVNPLSEKEALDLFLKKVGPKVSQTPALESTLRLVVKECAGLPLIILVVASTLKDEENPRIWEDALNDLKCRIEKVEGMEAKVIERLKFSYYHLKDEKVKHCFLYCALYPEDFEIEKDELIGCWIDEGFIDELDTRQQMIDKGHAILKKLKDNCLLENGGYSVKMHDAVRDMALSITSVSPRYMIKAGMQLKRLPKKEEWPADIEKVSLMMNSISEIPIDLSPPNCQLLTTLLLQQNPIKRIPDSFFANMPCLSVLDLSFSEIEFLPNSISELKNLTTLLLVYCESLKHLPSLSKLQGLKKLDLSFSSIEEVPEGMEMLVNLRSLDLFVSTLKEVPAGLLPKLSRLQHFRFDCRVEKTSIKAEEVVPLEKLEFFFGCFKDIHELNKFVQSMQCKKSLNRYQLQVGSCDVYYRRKDKVVSIGEPEFCGDEVLLPIDIQQLEISECDLLRSLSDISALKDAVDLRNCAIQHCKGIEFFLSFSFSTSCIPLFQSLEKLILWDLPRLSELIKAEGFVSGPPILAPPGTFSHLKEIYIAACSNITKLFPHWLLTNLQNLEWIRVGECEQLVEILAVATSEEDDDEEKGTDKIKVNLPKLRTLLLHSLPELKSICSKSGLMVCDSLELIAVGNCSKLKRIPPFLPLLGIGQPYTYAPPSLKIKSSREWWESLEWDHPNFKNVLQPRCQLGDDKAADIAKLNWEIYEADLTWKSSSL